ncbi:hypothetical protein CRM22_008228 [Opisthorchis felineus]|uniref:Uncharacterized protein n=1 Tax=Opisthorchis felineus TaxID=147828 RepID=A0A4S2LC41_OPIFE|nr:hypothetical protein CRM22_008228 [Opisthorchis felineus]
MAPPVTQQPESVQQREWTTNMFGCCEDVPRCFLVACCTPCYLCYMYKYDHEACFLPVFGAGPILLRVKHRFKYDIRVFSAIEYTHPFGSLSEVLSVW